MSEPFEMNLKDRRASRSNSAAASVVLPELRGKRAAWAGVESVDPMLRGCDQRELLDELVASGIRHLVVPLNSAAEDSCLFARKHVESKPSGETVVYDLDRRDEGAFTRLKFLLEAAASAGMMVGLSLVDASEQNRVGPFRRGGNSQGLTISENLDDRHADKLADVLNHVADWVASAARGFQGLWIECFRGACGKPGLLEDGLCARVAATLAKHGEDLSPTRLGPWVIQRQGGTIHQKHEAQIAPFEAPIPIASQDEFLDSIVECEKERATSGLFSRGTGRVGLARFLRGSIDGEHTQLLWHSLLRGYWPLVPMSFGKLRDAKLWHAVAAVARFGVAWAGRGPLRPAPDLRAKNSVSEFPPVTAEDGFGRYFLNFETPAANGVALSLLPGFYRWHWISSSEARVLDRGDGAEGGPQALIPGCADPTATLLVVENAEAPDSLSVW